MMGSPAVSVIVVALAVAGLLLAERRKSRGLKWACKPVASTGFVTLGLCAGAADTPYGRCVLVALAFGWVGDVLLLGASKRAFVLGLGSFLVGHAVFGVAFTVRGLGWPVVGFTAVVLVAPMRALWAWLKPTVPVPLRAPVVAYFLVISAMVALAAGTGWARRGGLIPMAALMFAASDISVARDRFKGAAWGNKAWGLPLYYAAQCLLAWSVAP